MTDLGTYLKLLRSKQSVTATQVCAETGISDSVLSHLENNHTQKPDATALMKLAKYYHVNVCTLYIQAGYLDNSFDQYKFRDMELLTEKEATHIQSLIDILNENKRKDGAV